MKKGIKISSENFRMLADRFRVEDDDIPEVLPLGYWLVTDYGNDDNFDTLTVELFEERFIKGGGIDNGWYDLAEIG